MNKKGLVAAVAIAAAIYISPASPKREASFQAPSDSTSSVVDIASDHQGGTWAAAVTGRSANGTNRDQWDSAPYLNKTNSGFHARTIHGLRSADARPVRGQRNAVPAKPEASQAGQEKLFTPSQSGACVTSNSCEFD